MKKVLVIAGATATGKSAFAVQCALKFSGEVINGDSQQVYRQLDIGTAKITQAEQQGIPHHLLDIIDYQEPYNVADFQRDARDVIDQITTRKKLPILCGGSGYYLKAVLYDYAFPKEEKQAETFSELNDQTLYQHLKEIDPISAEKIHPNNRKRVLRALNMGLSGTLKSQREATQSHTPIYDVYIIVLDIDRDQLLSRIRQRVKRMMDQGLEAEVKHLFNTTQAQSFQSFLGIGYKEFRAMLKGEENIEQTKAAIITHSNQFAKRQRTWFRHQFTAHWVNPMEPKALDLVYEDISQWLTKENS